MAKHLSSKTTVSTQVRILGKLAFRLNGDPRHPLDVMADFFAFSDRELTILHDAYRGDDDPIDAVIR